MKEIFIDYFKTFEEETIRDNFVLIYELLDEIMDHGYPQATESKILQNFITTESNQKKKEVEISKVLTNIVNWRNPGIAYKTNEAYLDVVESVDMLISSDGHVLHSQITGRVRARSYLSGMPTVTLGLNDKILFQQAGKELSNAIEMDDLKFHQCVDKKMFENDRTIQFIPPDGEFELMSYRLEMQIKPLLIVDLQITNRTETRIDYIVTAKTNFRNRSVASNVDVFIPVPSDLQNATFKSKFGKVVFLSDREDLLWSIKQFEGQKEKTMTCNFQVPTVRIDNQTKHLKRPIQVNFEIPYFTVSGLQVRYMKIIEKSNYEAVPWVRYVTKNGEYSIRMI